MLTIKNAVISATKPLLQSVAAASECDTAQRMDRSESCAPSTLYVIALFGNAGQRQCSGEYVLTGESWLGAHVWRQSSGERWLHLGPNRQWCVSGGSFRDGVVYLRHPTQGDHSIFPHELPRSWERQYSKASRWIPDASVEISLMPRGGKRKASGVHVQQRGEGII